MLRVLFRFIEIKIKIQINVVIENNKVGIIRRYINGYNVTLVQVFLLLYVLLVKF